MNVEIVLGALVSLLRYEDTSAEVLGFWMERAVGWLAVWKCVVEWEVLREVAAGKRCLACHGAV